jgi:hypothetical protein
VGVLVGATVGEGDDVAVNGVEVTVGTTDGEVSGTGATDALGTGEGFDGDADGETSGYALGAVVTVTVSGVEEIIPKPANTASRAAMIAAKYLLCKNNLPWF